MVPDDITAVASASVAVVLLGTAALFAARASSDESDVIGLVLDRDPNTGAPLRYSSSPPSTSSRRRDGPDHDCAAKIALAASAVVAAVSITFFDLERQARRDARGRDRTVRRGPGASSIAAAQAATAGSTTEYFSVRVLVRGRHGLPACPATAAMALTARKTPDYGIPEQWEHDTELLNGARKNRVA